MFNETFWVGLSFVLFVALVFKPVGRIIGNALDKRSHSIRDELEEATRLREEAQALLASFQRKQKEAVEEARNIISHAEEETKRIKEESENELEESLNKRIQLAMQKMQAHEAMVLDEVQNKAIDRMLKAVRALIEEHITAKQADKLIEEALSSVKKSV